MRWGGLMSEKRQQRWIIRYQGRIVYYPWSWMSFGALSAYVVDSPKIVRTAMRRRRRALLLAGLWAVLSYLFWMRLSVVMLAIDALVLYSVRRWEMQVLSGRSVRLPLRLSAALAAGHYEGLREQLARSVLVLLAAPCMLLWGNVWMLFRLEEVIALMVLLSVAVAHTFLLGYLRVFQVRTDCGGSPLIEEAQSEDHRMQTIP